MPEKRWYAGQTLGGVLFLAALLAALVTVFRSAPWSPGYQTLDADLGALRQRFNQDAGEARVLMLLSPT